MGQGVAKGVRTKLICFYYFNNNIYFIFLFTLFFLSLNKLCNKYPLRTHSVPITLPDPGRAAQNKTDMIVPGMEAT